jgi:ribosomal protein L31
MMNKSYCSSADRIYEDGSLVGKQNKNLKLKLIEVWEIVHPYYNGKLVKSQNVPEN